MPFKDLDHIRRLRRAESFALDAVSPAADPRRVVIYSMDPWQLGVVEQFLHLALQAKGHLPVSIYYDGLLPITAWENHYAAAPPVAHLKERARSIFDAFGIQPVGITRYLDRRNAEARARDRLDPVRDGELSEIVYRGVPIGRIALRDLFQYTVGHFEPRSAEDRRLYRRHVLHAAMSVDLAHAILDAERPDIVVLVNGKSVMYSYMYEVAQSRGTQVTTWEEGMFFDTGIVFANNARAIDFPISHEEWQRYRLDPLRPEQARRVESYFAKWRAQEATCYRYYDRELRDFETIRRALEIESNRNIISIFTNIVWDTNALDKDRAFDGMMDWVFETIEVVRRKPNHVLIIRAHPGEARWEYPTRTPVRQLVAERYGGRLPAHVRLVDGHSEFSSYEIAARSARCAVYTSTLGIELSLMGLEPLVCGIPFYSGKGFTNDVESKEAYADLLAGDTDPPGVDRDALIQFMHLVLFRLIKRPEFLVGIHGHPQRPKVRLESFAGFPESLPIFNEVVDCILSCRSFVSAAPEAPLCVA
ncbi:MAG: hypothetical protein ACE5F9_05530 [Phycisphaerae bacterium]